METSISSNKNTKIVRLGGGLDTYIKPETTYQQNLSKEQIREKLKGYRRVDLGSEDLAIDSHIRYFSSKDNKHLFRLGGFVKKYDKIKKYIVLTNNKNSWCVNCSNSIIYKKIDYEDYQKLEKENTLLKKYVKDYKTKVSELMKKISS